MAADYRTFDLSGTHYDLGLAQGRQTERFVVPAWWPEPPPLSFALDCARQAAELHPPLLDELHGYAEAQAIGYHDLLRGVCRRSMRLRAAMVAAPPYPEGGCSSFAAVTADGRVVAGRNYDFHSVQRVRQRLRLKPTVGRATVGMRGSVPGGRYDGVNDHGLFISLHVALSDEPEAARPGLPFHWLPRVVLETCGDTCAAVELLTHVRHLHPFNYLVADAGGDLALVEAHPEVVRVAARGDDFIAATNHYRHPELARFQRGRKLSHSQRRLDHLYSQREALRWSSASDLAGVQAALADHPSGLCGHAGGHTTLWSLSADLSARRLAYARGAPCVTAYEPVAWPV